MASVLTKPSPAMRPAEDEAAALWFKEALIYQVHVRAFYDSNGDGVGDFRGLTEKLGYIQDLGVTAIWMLPYFRSPLKDDGYDIADYREVNPQYGTLDDFRRLLHEAHRRDLKVITELVMNHTSDQHEWFQRARTARPGDPWRDWYVWSDTPEKYQEARIIFQDFEASNWSWDPVAGAYFWHRFYSHQPDLNFDNPAVREAMFDVVDYWLAMGVDGLRLDAVPYLYEREGTNCENLPETHAFLRDLRAHVDKSYDNRMLLAEANQWPEDAVAYFGDGDECHMNFNFPLMPRLFMAIEREDRSPIVDILDQTPILPRNCQWAIFLRNHDELTLEMVTDEERDYMYRTYAVDAHARINLGIRRRLAPLLRNNRRKIEIMNALLLSLPGTPIIYYGDEIGMGDNFYLGDRNGVRTPMHWSSDRNAGFSRANPQSLFLPVIIDPEYHYEFRNVEVEQANPHSLLWWMRRVLDLRKQYPAFGYGGFEALETANAKVFAFLRETDEEVILVVANLSRFAQIAEIDLSRFRGRTPIELFGQTAFPPIGDHPYQFTLGPHGFYWFCIGCRDEENHSTAELPVCYVRGNLQNVFQGRSRSVMRGALEKYLRSHRWFAGKARTARGTEVFEAIPTNEEGGGIRDWLLLVRVDYAEGEPDSYVVPVALVDEAIAEEWLEAHHGAAIARVEFIDENETKILCDATADEEFWHRGLEIIETRAKIDGQAGFVQGLVTGAVEIERDPGAEPHVHGGEQSNTSAIFGDKLIFKLFRRISEGVNPDFEIGCHLSRSSFGEHIPRVAGALEYRNLHGEPTTIAILHEYVANVGDAWTYALDELGRYFERVQSHAAPSSEMVRLVGGAGTFPTDGTEELPTDVVESAVASAFEGDFYPLLEVQPPSAVQTTVGAQVSEAELLGRRTAEMHLTLAAIQEDPHFRPESFTRLYQRSLYQSLRVQARSSIGLLRKQLESLDDSVRETARKVIKREQEILARLHRLLEQPIQAQRIRCHGDFHLGQVLFTGKDFVIIDFEGEPERPISERRIKASALRDVAAMLRSFHYVSHAALTTQMPNILLGHEDRPAHEWATFWYSWSAAAFLREYLRIAGEGRFLPPEPAQARLLLEVFLIEKALYELRYEMNNRPDWLKIPLEGLLQLVAGGESARDPDPSPAAAHP